MPESLASQNAIVGIADSGLVLRVDDVELVVPWSAILNVSAVMALVDRTSEQRIPVFVFGVVDGADERLFVVGETEPIWARLAASLPDYLPGLSSRDIWSAQLAASGEALLYRRAAGVQ